MATMEGPESHPAMQVPGTAFARREVELPLHDPGSTDAPPDLALKRIPTHL